MVEDTPCPRVVPHAHIQRRQGTGPVDISPRQRRVDDDPGLQNLGGREWVRRVRDWPSQNGVFGFD